MLGQITSKQVDMSKRSWQKKSQEENAKRRSNQGKEEAAAINSFPFSPGRKNLYHLSLSSLLVLILLSLINFKGLANIKLKI
mmetsp:Transcript_9511/g.12510  ORF Transcript_9511/g.12510 Transcript_9511/m.12510 type:complete len:82 (+) Transcript_9511:275-520(+)